MGGGGGGAKKRERGQTGKGRVRMESKDWVGEKGYDVLEGSVYEGRSKNVVRVVHGRQ